MFRTFKLKPGFLVPCQIMTLENKAYSLSLFLPVKNALLNIFAQTAHRTHACTVFCNEAPLAGLLMTPSYVVRGHT